VQIVSNTLAFLVTVGVVVFVHELGHHLVAKAFGVRVLTFSLGFGRRLWGFRRRGTDYRVSLIPLGGYVHFGGQDPAEATGEPGDYLSKPRWQRVLILVAGPAMNVVLAIALVAIVFMLGTRLGSQTDLPAVVGGVAENFPAAAAGLAAGDRLVSIDGQPVANWQEVSMAFLTSPERPVEVVFRRGDDERTTTVTPIALPKYELGEAGVYPAVPARVARVVPKSAAARAGLRFGDAIVRVGEEPVGDRDDFARYVEPRAGEAVVVTIERNGRERELSIVPEADEEGKGRVGVYIDRFHFQRFGPVEALAASVRHNVETTVQIFEFVGKIFERRISAQSALGGPIEIAAFSGAAARSRFRDLLFFMALISLNLCLLNMLPIPILDGGQISILLVESTLRRDLSVQMKERMTQVGLVLIVMIMAMALYFDAVKNLPVRSPEAPVEETGADD
jgi:regulator of sigma E protease